jgi:DNA-binding transcriptional ArsR family regulator
LLATLHPTLRWQSPVLEQEGGMQDHRLDGRGMLLAPSVFCRSPAMVCDNSDASGSWILSYPAVRDPQDALYLWTPPGRPDRALASLLGTTRPSVMETISGGRTTSELARSVAISPAAASEHTAVLRDAGLVSTRRIGQAVLHTLTPLGVALVEGNKERLDGRSSASPRSAISASVSDRNLIRNPTPSRGLQ